MQILLEEAGGHQLPPQEIDAVAAGVFDGERQGAALVTDPPQRLLRPPSSVVDQVVEGAGRRGTWRCVRGRCQEALLCASGLQKRVALTRRGVEHDVRGPLLTESVLLGLRLLRNVLGFRRSLRHGLLLGRASRRWHGNAIDFRFFFLDDP